MNRRTTIAAAAVAAGAGVFLLAPPVAASSGAFGAVAGVARSATDVVCPMWDDVVGRGPNGTDPGSGYGMRGRWSDDDTDGTGQPGYGMRGGMGAGMGNGVRGGAVDPGANLPAKGTLTSAQTSTLVAMAEEEKLAHDVYVALADATGDRRFTMVAASEQRHLDAVRVLLDRYGVKDPTAGRATGSFATASVQTAYADYVARGKASTDAALAVGRDIEKADVADLGAALKGLNAADVTTVYQRLLAASEHHLAAFGG